MISLMKGTLLTTFCVCIIFYSRASIKTVSSGSLALRSNDAVFHGRVTDVKPGDELFVYFYRDYIATGTATESILTNSFNLRLQPDSQGKFNFILPDLTHLAYLELVFRRNGNDYIINQRFIVEPGDNINFKMTVLGDSLTSSFTGKGYEKYLCANFFGNLHETNGKYLNKFMSDKTADERFDDYFYATGKFISDGIANLQDYKGRINPQVYSLMEEDIKSFADSYRSYVVALVFSSGFNREYSDKFKGRLVNEYRKKYRSEIDMTNVKLFSISDNYIKMVVLQMIADLAIQYMQIPTTRDVFINLKLKYSGTLLDRTIARLLLDPFIRNGVVSYDQDEYNLCVQEATSIVTIPFIQEALKEQSIGIKGETAFNFTLVDTAGQSHELSDFKGKVVLMDTWFTGCGGCAIAYRYLRDSIEPVYRDNQNFKIISVNVDKDVKMWLKSIYKNMYTDPSNALNLYSGEINKSFIITYYHVDGLPLILLIDKKGKILSRQTNLLDISQVRKIIDEALLE